LQKIRLLALFGSTDIPGADIGSDNIWHKAGLVYAPGLQKIPMPQFEDQH
jgi:hypothetical protein